MPAGLDIPIPPPQNRPAHLIEDHRLGGIGIIHEDKSEYWNHVTKLGTGLGPLRHTKIIDLELSNICNYATSHKKCPLHEVHRPTILSEELVFHVLETCKKFEFRGMLRFSIYNEPGIDPRLMMFIREAKRLLPDVSIDLLTNGFYLDEGLANEFAKYGVSFIRISAYSKSEYERFTKFQCRIPIVVTLAILRTEFRPPLR